MRATLVVAPAAILGQWEEETRKHFKHGTLKVATYLGLGGPG